MAKYRLAIFIGVTLLLVVAGAVILLIRHGLELSRPKQSVSLSVEQFQDAIRKAGGEVVLAKEADEAIRQFGKSGASAYQLKNCPAIEQMSALIEGEIVGVWASAGGVPAHIRLRRGGHFDYQFIYIFPSASVSTTNLQGLKLVAGSIFLRNTAPEK